MVVACFINSHGLKMLATWKSVKCTFNTSSIHTVMLWLCLMGIMDLAQRMKPIVAGRGVLFAIVLVSPEVHVTMTKKSFLANPSIKQTFINLLAEQMTKDDIAVEHAKGDADYKICMSACLQAKEMPTAVAADDSDVFQLLMLYANIADKDLYMVTSKQTVCVTTLAKTLNSLLSGALIFLHASSGCNTTS